MSDSTYVETKMQSYTVQVNSKNNWRNSGTDSDFIYEIDIDDNMGFDHVVVKSALIPISWYNVPQDKNYFTLTEDGKSSIITIPAMNYTRSQLANTLTSLLTSGSPNGYNYTCTFPISNTEGESGHFFFTVTGNGGVQPVFTF